MDLMKNIPTMKPRIVHADGSRDTKLARYIEQQDARRYEGKGTAPGPACRCVRGGWRCQWLSTLIGPMVAQAARWEKAVFKCRERVRSLAASGLAPSPMIARHDVCAAPVLPLIAQVVDGRAVAEREFPRACEQLDRLPHRAVPPRLWGLGQAMGLREPQHIGVQLDATLFRFPEALKAVVGELPARRAHAMYDAH